MGSSTKDKTRREISKLITQYSRQKRIINTWDLIKVPSFHLRSDLIVLDKDELEHFLHDLFVQIQGLPKQDEGGDH